MTNNALTASAPRLLGQQLGSVMIAIDYITLNFAKYPLTSTGAFSDSAAIDIEEGFEVVSDGVVFTIRKGMDLRAFQRGAAHFLGLIGQHITHTDALPNGELALQFDGHTTVRLLTSPAGFDAFDVHFGA